MQQPNWYMEHKYKESMQWFFGGINLVRTIHVIPLNVTNVFGGIIRWVAEP